MRLEKSFLSIVIVFLVFSPAFLLCQEKTPDTNTVYCNPRVFGLPRPTGISIEYERVLDYKIHTHSNVDYYSDGNGEVNYNRRIKFKLRLPIVNKNKFKFTWGFSYGHEEFRFDEPDQLDYSFYQSLEDKSLKSLGTNFYFVFPSKKRTFIGVWVDLNLNGDYYRNDVSLWDFLKVSAAPFFGIKKHDNLMYGFGFAYSYTFGDPSITPVIGYYHTFNKHWGIEAMLPFEAKVRYNINEGGLLYAGAKVRGASYNIHLNDSILSRHKTLELRHSEIKFFVSLRKEIYDFLWFSVYAGYRYNLNFNLADSNQNRSATNFFGRDYILESQLDGAFFFNISLDIVAPKKWYYKKH